MTNSPGFNIANAMTVEDVKASVNQLSKAYYRGNRKAPAVYGRMITVDREASLSDYRDGLNQYARYSTIADNVALDIEYAIEHGFDRWPNHVY